MLDVGERQGTVLQMGSAFSPADSRHQASKLECVCVRVFNGVCVLICMCAFV